jgi:hypothetical protein
MVVTHTPAVLTQERTSPLKLRVEISVSHDGSGSGSARKKIPDRFYILGYYAVLFFGSRPKFRRNKLPPSSVLKSKPGNKPAQSRKSVSWYTWLSL